MGAVDASGPHGKMGPASHNHRMPSQHEPLSAAVGGNADRTQFPLLLLLLLLVFLLLRSLLHLPPLFPLLFLVRDSWARMAQRSQGKDQSHTEGTETHSA